ncbi:MAG: flagellar motor stator protein MotA [Verrucomicrobia subdivision 3 bacterium]|nr:flagellar motor stator protein MotA [Verrucomicrobiota bacterium]MCC6820444.1 flagellar motor stator protein MotA [Limisphaerales bacterium]
MIIIIGAIIVTVSIIGGFMMAGGHLGSLIQVAEFVVIVGAATGALVIMSPKKVIIDLFKYTLAALKGSPYNKAAYEDLFKALYELFMLGRRNGMIALEDHVMNPQTSSIFTKYPNFLKDHHAVELLCGGLRPIIDGKVKPDQLKLLLDTELDSMEEEHHKPVDVLTKAADAMPGFGIVAAVLGIVVTMGSIAGPIEEIGHHVAAALVGTFLGILISYGYLNPLAVNIGFLGLSELAYFRCIATAVVGFANGMAPIMAIEVARRGLSSELKPTADELETVLKSLNSPAPS